MVQASVQRMVANCQQCVYRQCLLNADTVCQMWRWCLKIVCAKSRSWLIQNEGTESGYRITLPKDDCWITQNGCTKWEFRCCKIYGKMGCATAHCEYWHWENYPQHLLMMIRMILFKGGLWHRYQGHCNGVLEWGREMGSTLNTTRTSGASS